MPHISRTISSFSLAFGQEDGTDFCAILWPLGEGDIPFVSAPFLKPHLDGFVVFDADHESVLGFFGVDPDSRRKMLTHEIVILVPRGDGFSQMEVISPGKSPSIVIN